MLKFPIVNHPDELKVAILLLSKHQPVWVVRILAIISGLSFVKISFLIPREGMNEERNANFPARQKIILKNLFNTFDRMLHLRKIESFQEVEIDPTRYSDLIFSFNAHSKDDRVTITGKELQAIIEMNLDLIFYFEDFPVSDIFHFIPRFGLCPYANQFLQWRIPEKVAQFLLNLYEKGDGCIAKNPYTSTLSLKCNWTDKPVSNLRYVYLASKIILEKIYRRLFDLIYRERWEIAFQFSDRSILKENKLSMSFRFKPPVKNIYGDPFPVKMGDKYFLFFEEMAVDEVDYKLTGHISVIELDRKKGPIGKIQKVLERKYHLSYPFIFSWNGEYYMVPETHQNKTVELYRCVSFPDKWEFSKNLLEEIDAVDVTLLEKDQIWWLFASVPQMMPDDITGFIQPHMYSLYIYYSDSPLGTWQQHPQNPVKTDRKSTRSAGRFFLEDGVYYRPAQDCSPRYGYSLVINQIDLLTTKEYKETECTKILPTVSWDTLGIHTFNSCDDLKVIDYKRYRNRFLP